MHYKSFQDISLSIWRYLHRLPRQYDLIVGVPRSGMIPATMLSLYLNTYLASLDDFLEGKMMLCGQTRTSFRISFFDSIRNVLVMDDSIYSGASMKECKSRIEESSELKNLAGIHIDYASVYSATGKDTEVDFFFEVLPPPRCFQWNIFNHPSWTCQSCYDIDGVLARDPTTKENDDGVEYRKFLTQVPARLPLKFPVGAFVTSRLEKYRDETAQWLAANGYRYKDLIMLDLPSKAERIRINAHASFKANIYRRRSERLFVESEWKQAQEIARISGKDVFCTENMQYIHGHAHR